MSRRVLVVLSVVCVAALSVTAVALARSGSGDKGGAKGTAHAGKRGAGKPATRLIGGGLLPIVLDSLAKRLDVAPADLRAAVDAIVAEQRQKRLQAAGLTPAEIAALKACRQTGLKKRDAARVRPSGGASCDPALLRSARAKLKAARQTKPDLAALKTELATSLATKLGKTPDEVLAAVRAELDARLTQAVSAGWLTQKGHDLALACFDAPASCDLKALKAEVRFLGHGKRGRHHRHGKPSPGDTGSGQMTPGGRATSTPLR
jgi:hypothetical protein